MRAPLTFALLLSALTVACTQAEGPAPLEAHAAPALACAAPRLVLSTPSPFAEALEIWSKEPGGSARAHAALLAACTDAADSARGTEHAACTLLGLAYAAGDGVPRDPHQAFAYLERGARCGFDFGAHDLANAEDQRIVSGLASCCGGHSCEAGCEEACARATAATASAIGPALLRACRAGRPTACFMLATADDGEYLQAIGRVKVVATEASAALLERSCAGGLGVACERLAYREEGGETKRARLFERACALGWGLACLHLGKQIEHAGGRAKAIPRYEEACRLGLRNVCTELGDILSKGEGVPVDHERAARVEALSWRAR